MPRLLKNNEFHSDTTITVSAETELSSIEQPVLVPVKLWLADASQYQALSQPVGLLFEPDDEPESVADQLSHFDVIAVSIPGFMDGRAYSIARILRDRYGFEGEIRAVGDVLIDQIYYLETMWHSAAYLTEGRPESGSTHWRL